MFPWEDLVKGFTLLRVAQDAQEKYHAAEIEALRLKVAASEAMQQVKLHEAQMKFKIALSKQVTPGKRTVEGIREKDLCNFASLHELSAFHPSLPSFEKTCRDRHYCFWVLRIRRCFILFRNQKKRFIF